MHLDGLARGPRDGPEVRRNRVVRAAEAAADEGDDQERADYKADARRDDEAVVEPGRPVVVVVVVCVGQRCR